MSEKKTKEKTTNLDYKSFSAITEIEEKYPVYDLEFKDGSKIWNPLRIYLYFYILEAELRNKDIFYKKIFNMLLEGIKPIHIPKKHYTICAFSSGRNRRLRENHYYDIMMDPIHEAIDKPMLICEWPGPNGKHRTYDKPLFSKDMTKIQLSIYQKAFWKLLFQRIAPNINPTQSSKELFYNILTHYATKTSSDVNQLITDAEKYIAILPTMKQFFNTFLQQITPSIVLLVGGHSGFNMALIQACKEQQIPTVELQHGLITRYHAAYIKQKKTSNYDYRPDYLFTYGDYFTNLIQQNHAFPAKNVITVGYPYLNKVKKVPPVISEDLQNHLKKYKKNIIITSQWNIAEEILTFTLSLATLLQKSKIKIGIIFKPHPSDWRDYIAHISHSNIYIANKYEDTYDLFKVSDIHSTVYSTSGLEALAFAKPNIFIDIGKISISNIFDIVDNKTCYIVYKPEQYLKLVEYLIKNYNKISKEALRKSHKYFYPDSEKNLKTYLQCFSSND
jgi:CDP-glycerol:poly(glycerophosphate) glycerophosphotransferase